MSSPNENTSPHTRAFYDNQAARRRQLSSGPLGGDCEQSLVVFVVPNPYVRCTVFSGFKGRIFHISATKYSMFSPSTVYLSAKRCSTKQAPMVNLQKSLIIKRDLTWPTLVSAKKYFVSNCAPFTYSYRRLTKSLKLTENTACFSAARKNLFREMATRAARIVCDDLAARCRSLAPVR